MQKAPLHRGLSIIRFVAEQETPVGFQDVADGLDLNITTARRLLLDLSAAGMLAHDPDLKKFTLGVEFLRTCAMALSGRSVLGLVRPVMRGLVDELGETCCFYALDRADFKSVLLLVERSGKALDYDLPIGQRGPLHAGSGKAILAHLEPDLIETVLSGDVEQITDATLRSRKEILESLEQIRGDGVSVSRGERVEGAVGVAAPVFDRSQLVVGALVLTVPKIRLDVDPYTFADDVRQAADDISETLAEESFALGLLSGLEAVE